MIVDAHLHVWRAVPDYPQPTATTVSPVSDVPVELLSEYMEEHGVGRAVLVQPLYPGEDNSYVADCAAAAPDRFAAVCVVDPRSPGAAERLQYWVQERGCRGLRLRPKFPPEAACFGHPDTFPLWERLAGLGAVVNLLCGPEHFSTAGSLARRFPSVPIAIDHMGHPDPAGGTEAPAFQDLLALADFPNVYVKVSGQYYYSKRPYPFDDCRDLVRAVYDRFGAQRLIWGSDFPHVLLKSGYSRTLHLPDRAYEFISPSDRALLFGENAVRLFWGR
jgi:L-fuconolactonase